MISYFNRLRAKKGFTLIELIVVIAIIGVLTTIIVAAMSGDSRVTKGKGLAKDIYYVSQDAFSKVKMAHSDAIKDNERVGFYVTVGSDGNVGTVGYFTASAQTESAVTIDFDPDHPEEPASTASDAVKSYYKAVKALRSKVPEALKNYLTSADAMAGTLYVVCDDNFRVQTAYWKSGAYGDAADGTSSRRFSADDTLDNGEVCCAFPTAFSKEGKYFLGK